MLRKSLAIAALLVPALLAAQEVLGVATDVQGLVTVTSGNTLSNAASGLPIPDGARVVTGNSGFAVLDLASGCKLNMRPNQSITIDKAKPCPELQAALEASTRTAALLQPGPNPALVSLVTAAGLGAMVVVDALSSQ